MYKSIIRPYLFKMDAEDAHHFAFRWYKRLLGLPFARSITRGLYKYENPKLVTKLWGLEFPNPVGLAAGLDKDAKMIDEFAELGFGFIEIGTLTPLAQDGNPRPRLFRLLPDEAIINRMGFNNQGAEAAAQRLAQRKSKVIVGGNIGKNKVTPNEEAVSDYIKAFNTLYDHVDYFVVNVSSPNTPNLRALQDREPLEHLLRTVQNLNLQKPKAKPVLLKIAPDLTDTQLDDVVEIVHAAQIAGIIATNTTIGRDNLKSPAEKTSEAGGLSGKPLTTRSTDVIRYLRAKTKLPIIGVGGIFSAEDAIEKLRAGANLVQVYSGFIYEGPALVRQINEAIAREPELLQK